ncbi:MAG: right-handed parallel beta-helix repeat-containing protein [Haloglomus sp.]
MDSRRVVLAAVVALAVSPAPFLAQPGGGSGASPVPFDETKTVGLSDRTTLQATESSVVIPQAEVYYARYRYVVGYWGVTSLLARLRTQQQRELGRPLAVFVSDFAGRNLTVTDERYLRLADGAPPDWTTASEAYFVVNSSARIPTRNTTVVPFSVRRDAVAFARRYGGEVRRWEELQSLPVGRVGRSLAAWQDLAERRQARADRVVRRSRGLLPRPVSVSVGSGTDSSTVDNETRLRAAIRRAPPNTTVRLGPGTYHTDGLTVTKPLTLRGAGPDRTRIVGDGNGSVVTVTAPRTAIAGVSIVGVGNDRTGLNDTDVNVSVPRDSWKYDYYKIHGYGDAAVVFDEAPASRVSSVHINTTSSGIVARNSPGTVVTNLTLYGTKRHEDGFLGVSAIGAGVVVQHSRFYGGKVGVYSYDAPGLVVRDCETRGMLVGVLNLYSPRSLLTDNTVDDVWNGIYLETQSYGNIVAENFLHNTRNGFVVEGRANYLARNTVVHSVHGTQVEGGTSRYWRNVLAYNRIGARSDALLPSNRVSENVFLGNAEYVETQRWNVLHVWRGNYWDGAAVPPFDRPGRTFRPTGPVDSLARVPGARTLAAAPATSLYRRLQRVVPGLRAAGVVDPAPLERPPEPVRWRALRARYGNRTGPHPDADPWDFEA